MKKIVLIPDSFKGTMSSARICLIMQKAIHKIFPGYETSGGGAIYCDTENMQYSFITKKTGDDVDSSFKKFAKPILIFCIGLTLA